MSVSSDPSRKINFNINYHFHLYDDQKSSVWDLNSGITIKPTNIFQIHTNFAYSENINGFQYVNLDEYQGDKPYILGRLYQRTYGFTARFDMAITPDFTIQYYGNPYFSMGKYSAFKRVINPESRAYSEIYKEISGDEIIYLEEENKFISHHTDVPFYGFKKPDFNYQEFRSNFVIRWEYKAGSAVYLVWTHGRASHQEITNFSLDDNYSHLKSLFPENVFLLKINYWFSV